MPHIRFSKSLLVALTLTALCALSLRAAPSPDLLRTPANGIQPQAVLDSAGTLHLIYLKGEPAAADIYYVSQRAGSKTFTAPLKVNHEPGAAIAVGTIRGAQLAVARGYVHVLWNGHAPKGGNYLEAPLLYTRLAPKAAAFERERNLISTAGGLDGGSSIAADDRGNVFAFWHAPQPGSTNGEPGRALFLARSSNDGGEFAREIPATSDSTGACACCGMKAFVNAEGDLFAIFRSAPDLLNRDEILLAGRPGEPLKPVLRHPWRINMCPMSSASFASSGPNTWAAWESRDNVFFARVTANGSEAPISPAVASKKKHPALASNSKGELLLVWTEGTAWGKGGSIRWQLYDSDGGPKGEPGRADGLPAWSLATAAARSDGSFVIIY